MFNLKLLLAILLVLGACSHSGEKGEERSSPVVGVETPIENFEQGGLAKLELVRNLEFKNLGVDEVVIASVATTCNCTIPDMDFPVILAAGATFELPVNITVPAGDRRFRQTVVLYDTQEKELARSEIAIDRNAPLEFSSYRLRPWIVDGKFQTEFSVSSNDLSLLSRLTVDATSEASGVVFEVLEKGYADLEDGRYIRIFQVMGDIDAGYAGGPSLVEAFSLEESSSVYSIEVIPIFDRVSTYGK